MWAAQSSWREIDDGGGAGVLAGVSQITRRRKRVKIRGNFRPTRAENICISFFCPGAHFFCIFASHRQICPYRINRRYGNECAKGRESAGMKHLIRQWEFSLWLEMIIDQSGYDWGEFNFPENFAKQQRRETWAWGFLGYFFSFALLQHRDDIALRQIGKLHFVTFPVSCTENVIFLEKFWQQRDRIVHSVLTGFYLFIYFVKISLTFSNISEFSASVWLTLIFTLTQPHTISRLSFLINYLYGVYILPGLARQHASGGKKLCDLIRNWIGSHYKSRKYI